MVHLLQAYKFLDITGLSCCLTRFALLTIYTLILFEPYKQWYRSVHSGLASKYLLLAECEVRTASNGPSFFSFLLWPNRGARGP